MGPASGQLPEPASYSGLKPRVRCADHHSVRGRGTTAAMLSGAVVEKPDRSHVVDLRRLLCVPTDPLNLAVLRIVVFGAILVFLPLSHAAQLAALPEALVRVPAGAAWLVALPRSATLVTWASWFLACSCVLAIIGWRTRLAVAAAAVLSFYVLGVPQLYGKVDHYHHLVWLAALLALSPCGDALSIDGRHRQKTGPSIRHGMPIRIAWLLIGTCYFFPGLAKVVSAHWFDPRNGQRLLDVQRWAAGLPPMQVPDALLLGAAVATVVLELGFVFLVFSRWRPWAVAMALAFHLATFAVMGIFFWSLILCYVALFDWSVLAPRRCSAAQPAPTTTADDEPGSLRRAAYAGLVGAVLIAGAAFSVNGWPFASYPTFADRYDSETATIEVVARTSDGRELPVELLRSAPISRRTAMTWNALSHPHALQLVLDDMVLWTLDSIVVGGSKHE